LFCQEYTNNEYIIWNKDRKLKWEDYKGVPDTNSFAKAITEYEIKVTTNFSDSQPQFTIVPYFYMNSSWTKRVSSITLLAHEQLHFDIAELCARKIRKTINLLNDSLRNNTTYSYAIIDSLISENNLTQDQYDKETRHGTKPIEQKEWEEKILKELEELSEYEYIIREKTTTPSRSP